MIKFVEHRVADSRILRLIQKWLKAGVMEEGKWSEPQTGTAQGSVISPLLLTFTCTTGIRQVCFGFGELRRVFGEDIVRAFLRPRHSLNRPPIES